MRWSCFLALLALVFRANLFCPPEINFTCHGDYSNVLPSARATFFWPKLLACWLRTATKRTAILDGDTGSSAFFLNLLSLCGDISLNNGPGINTHVRCAVNLLRLTKGPLNAIIVIAGTMHVAAKSTMLLMTPSPIAPVYGSAATAAFLYFFFWFLQRGTDQKFFLASWQQWFS